MRSKNSISFGVVAIAMFLSCEVCAEGEENTRTLIAEIKALALSEIETSKTPSLQVSIGARGKIRYEGAFGLADIENGVKATPKTKYRTASVAKWFTATAAMRLAENGALDLDKPVQTYCPQFPVKKWVITPRDLLTQTSGIRHYIDYDEVIAATTSDSEKERLVRKQLDEIVSSYTRYTDVISPLRTFSADPLLFKPGAAWVYSSFGYRLLGCVIEGAAKTEYASLMKNLIFDPTGMRSTMPDDAWKVISNRAAGYNLGRNKTIRRADLRDVSENLPAGGYLSTASDLVRFALKFNAGLVDSENKLLMSSPIIGDLDVNSPDSWRDAIPQQDKYGYGLMLFSKYELGMVGHTGRQAGGSAIVILLPEDDIAIAVMSNAKGWNGYLNFVEKIKEITKINI